MRQRFGIFLFRACFFIILLHALVLAVSGSGYAAEPREDFNAWLQGLQQEALAAGISRPTIDAAFFGIKPIPKVIALDRNQPEAKLSLDAYLARVVPPARIEKPRPR